MMVHLLDVTLTMTRGPSQNKVLERVTLSLPLRRHVAFLMPFDNLAKSIIDMLTGRHRPDAGLILSEGTISPQLGDDGILEKALIVGDNLDFLARMNGQRARDVRQFMIDTFDFGEDVLVKPTRTLPPRERRQVAFALGCALAYDCYCAGARIIPTGKGPFQAKAADVVTALVQGAGLFLFTEDRSTVNTYCDLAVVYRDRQLVPFEDLDEAWRFHGE